MTHGVNDSQFYMWRTLFAVAHADDVVTDEEVRFMAEALEDVPFSEGQRAVLNEDAKHAQDIQAMFAGVADVHDQAVFFKFATELVHIDGEYGAEEQAVMLKLQELHVKASNIDDLIGTISMEFEDDSQASNQNKDFKETVFSFRDAFMQRRFKKD